jgi:hypothetical protein
LAHAKARRDRKKWSTKNTKGVEEELAARKQGRPHAKARRRKEEDEEEGEMGIEGRGGERGGAVPGGVSIVGALRDGELRGRFRARGFGARRGSCGGVAGGAMGIDSFGLCGVVHEEDRCAAAFTLSRATRVSCAEQRGVRVKTPDPFTPWQHRRTGECPDWSHPALPTGA